MTTSDIITKAKELFESGNITEAYSYIIEACNSAPDNLELQYIAGLWLFNNAHNTPELLQIFDRAVAHPQFAQQDGFLYAYAYISYYIGGDDTHYERANQLAKQAISINPEHGGAYHVLISSLLAQQKYTDAFLVSAAAMHNKIEFGSEKIYILLNRLAKILMSGIKVYKFNYSDHTFSMPLNTQTPACVNIATYYMNSTLFEGKELLFTKSFVGQANRILEVGTLIGNHTAYYMHILKPKQLIAFEALPDMAEVTRFTAELNQDEDNPCDVIVHNAFAGNSEGSAEIRGITVPEKPIDSLVEGAFDFIKIDVDGAEMSVLEGAERTLCDGTPKLMIEAAQETDSQVREWLTARGFEEVHAEKYNQYTNYFFIKRDA